jgi:hypothetical protein
MVFLRPLIRKLNMRWISILPAAFLLVGCTTIETILTAPTASDLNVYIAQIEIAETNLNQSVLSLVQSGYIKKDSPTAKTISLILAGANAAVGEAEQDYAKGDTAAALLAFNTAKSAYDSVNQQIAAMRAN